MRVRLGWACENSQGWWVGQKSRRMAVLLENFSFFSLQSKRERKANRSICLVILLCGCAIVDMHRAWRAVQPFPAASCVCSAFILLTFVTAE